MDSAAAATTSELELSPVATSTTPESSEPTLTESRELPVATSTPEAREPTRTKSRKLRRLNTVLLDTNIAKKKQKLDSQTVPDTPLTLNEDAQFTWPSPQRETVTPPPTVSPLNGANEAGDGHEDVSKPASFHLEGNRFVTVDTFQGKTFVSIRQYFQRKGCSTLLPSKKGVTLKVEEWAELKKCAQAFSEIVEKCEHNVFTAMWHKETILEQGENDSNSIVGPFKMISTSFFKGQLYFSVREHIGLRYRENGIAYPRKNGIHLSGNQWKILHRLMPLIDEELENIVAEHVF